MKNKVIVTRAPHLKSVPFNEIPDGTICLKGSGIFIERRTEARVALKAGPSFICISDDYYLDYELPKDDTYVTFPSFDDACAWVTNGKRLEDLQGYGKSEWEQLRTLGLGSVFTEAGKTYQIQNFGLGGDCTTTIEAWCLETSTMVEFNNERMAWPIGAGDTITIEITE